MGVATEDAVAAADAAAVIIITAIAAFTGIIRLN